MSASSAKIIQLRQLLADRFGSSSAYSPPPCHETGLSALDEIGLPAGALTEIVSSAPSANPGPIRDASPSPGPGLLLYALLHAALKKGERLALIDGKDSFAPRDLPQARRLLWLRCPHAADAVKAADLLVRDGNVPLVILFLNLNPAAELRRIPATAWHRLQMLAEKSAVTLLLFTPQAQIGCARLRISAAASFPLTQLHHRRDDLLPALRLQVERRRMNQELTHENVRRPACA